MDGNLLIATIAIIALLAGLAAGYWLGSKPVAEMRTRLGEREEDFKTAIAELGEAKVELSAASRLTGRASKSRSACLRNRATSF